MNCSYVCASCRRRLLQRARELEHESRRSASYISFQHPLTTSTAHDGDSTSQHSPDLRRESRRPRSIPEQQPLRSVEDDFLERLLVGKGRSNAQGPYSRPRKPRARPAVVSVSGDSNHEQLPASSHSVAQDVGHEQPPTSNPEATPETMTGLGGLPGSDTPPLSVLKELPSQLLLSTFSAPRIIHESSVIVQPVLGSRPLVRRHQMPPDQTAPPPSHNGRSIFRGSFGSLANKSDGDTKPVLREVETNLAYSTSSKRMFPNTLVVSHSTTSVPIPGKVPIRLIDPLKSAATSPWIYNAPILPNKTTVMPVFQDSESTRVTPTSLFGRNSSVNAIRPDSSGLRTVRKVGFEPERFATTFRRLSNSPVLGLESTYEPVSRQAESTSASSKPTSKRSPATPVPQQQNISRVPLLTPQKMPIGKEPHVADQWNAYLNVLVPSPENGNKRSRKSPSLRPPRRLLKAGDGPALENGILDPLTSLAKAWQMYLKLQQQSVNGKVSLSIQRSLFKRILHAWCGGEKSGLQLNPSLVLRRFYHKPDQPLDIPSWTNALWEVITKAAGNVRSNLSESLEPSNQALAQELMHLWSLGLTRAARCQVMTERGLRQVDKVLNWNSLLESEEMKQVRTWFSKGFAIRFSLFFPSLQPNTGQHIDSAALITFILFRARCLSLNSTEQEYQSYQPFQTFIAHLLPYSDFLSQTERYKAALITHGTTSEDAAFILEALKELPNNAASLPITKGLPLPSVELGATPTMDYENRHRQLEEQFKRRIGRAIEDQNSARLEGLWREIQSTFVQGKSDPSKTIIPVSLFGQLLTAFMALKRPNRAIDIWNVMVQGGMEPTIEIWDAMLKGCGIAGDVKAIDDVWSKMVESGIQPDAQIWATRIHNITQAGHWRSGIRAFGEMTTIWADHAKAFYEGRPLPELATLGDIDGVPKPNTQTLNGLVAGLARFRKHDELVKILGLGRSLGIKSDIYTFNPLFRSAMQAGNSTLAMKLLNQMQSLDIKPDVATFTMILQSLFRNDGTYNPSTEDAQNNTTPETTAANILQQMSRSGLEANAWTFATLINGLLKGSTGGNIQGAYAVISYMTTHDIALSSQIYTALLTYHFDQQPAADIAAVEALWNRARMDSRVFLDVFFFDRLIEGFAKCGEIGRMTAALAHAGKRGKVPGWPAMTEVVKALARTGDWTRVEEIVATVREEVRSEDEVRAGKGNGEFMRVVAEMGYDEQLERVDDGDSRGEHGEGEDYDVEVENDASHQPTVSRNTVSL